ncbi:K(+)-transporting ATPase subunit F [Microbispora sp. H11081]|nr:K(+)-transporting ATPase subunit F [Microbispora sp. H11081]
MSVTNAVGLGVAAALLVFMVAALLFAERF